MYLFVPTYIYSNIPPKKCTNGFFFSIWYCKTPQTEKKTYIFE